MRFGKKERPYVVSEDVRLLLQRWAREYGFTLPDISVFEQIQSQFKQQMSGMFDDFRFVTDQEITDGLATHIASHRRRTVISLSGIYYDSPLRYEVTRGVDTEGKNECLVHRAGAPTIEEQIDQIAAAVKGEVILVDDVVFSGHGAVDVIKRLGARGITVTHVYAGIAISKGARRIQKAGTACKAVFTYKEVVDEVCERDFFPGVPLCGRLVHGTENASMPYILPFGKPKEWASIPEEHAVGFSAFCIDKSIELFSAIERCSDRAITSAELPRNVHGLEVGTRRFVEALEEVRNSL